MIQIITVSIPFCIFCVTSVRPHGFVIKFYVHIAMILLGSYKFSFSHIPLSLSPPPSWSPAEKAADSWWLSPAAMHQSHDRAGAFHQSWRSNSRPLWCCGLLCSAKCAVNVTNHFATHGLSASQHADYKSTANPRYGPGLLMDLVTAGKQQTVFAWEPELDNNRIQHLLIPAEPSWIKCCVLYLTKTHTTTPGLL